MSAPDLVKAFYDTHPDAPRAFLRAPRRRLLRRG
jgi:hypothetical protein